MSLVAAFSGGTGGGSINAAGGSDSKRKLSARNSVTGASGTNTASAFSLGGMSTEGSYSALPHANSSSSLSNAGSYGQLQQLYSPTTSTSEFNMRQTGLVSKGCISKWRKTGKHKTEEFKSGISNSGSYIKWKKWTMSRLFKSQNFSDVIAERPRSASENSEPIKKRE